MQASLLEELPFPLYTLLSLQIIQNIVIFAISIFIGLRLSRKVGLSLPILECWSRGGRIGSILKAISGFSIILGVVAAIIIILLDLLFYFMFPNESVYAVELPQPPLWQGFLASFYGGINEEVLNRLFLMSLLLWIFSKIKKTEEGKPVGFTVWLAIIIAAIIFGLLHIPSAAVFITITPFVVIRSVILNGVAGVIFGWLYWRKGLESAMISHFTADIVIHGILPLFIQSLSIYP